ncbi:peptide ABC transporter [Rhodococcus sp. SC4]|uniref:ABC transporter permease n=2 Tax=unclassified Rhodococcus (in: high G+C Gram-positive bacteria) TaxID=192944 RepID=UPI00076A6C85|nr:ABC transporter permease [Rhodococcus sp. LB1]KXF57150.1 peptide ABC transporter [Rhodococcus sp. SC4]KXX61875.1 peptide ABC transporter [Rhodococcus sp. LB1]PBC56427.1 ABC transporter permease [Rhodococcus sp. ACPA1]
MALIFSKRVGRSLLVLFLVTVAVVGLLGLAPGSVADVVLGENATPEAVAQMNTELGLDRPLWRQYVDWLGSALHGDLGSSPITGQDVTQAILDRLPVTIELAVMGLFLGVAIAIVLAVVAAATEGTAVDRAISAVSSGFLAVPAFIAGPVLIYFLGVQLGWFPVSGWSRISDGLGANLQHAFLPAVAIALVEVATFQRLLRTDLVSTLREDFVSAARAKGMPRTYVLFRHALRPSSFSLITMAGISLGRLIGGTVVVEILFGLPGLGQLVSSSITVRDVITVQGIVVFIALVYVVVNMLVDTSYGFLDPRVRKAVRA